jgi:peptide-methionine (S)-S-oxide reductase
VCGLGREWRLAEPKDIEVTPASQFFMAGDYQYFRLNGHQPYCQFVVSPKVSKFRKLCAAIRDAS